jgi:hypothetical protein
VIAAQRDDGRVARRRELAHPRDDSRRIWTAVDVVAEEHHSVVVGECGETFEQSAQRGEIAVDVADREGPTCHRVILV